MKELKIKKIKLDEYGIEVNEYITKAEVQTIATGVATMDSWANREANKDMMILKFTTNIPQEELSELDYDIAVGSGLISAVKASIKNIDDIDKAIAFEDSWFKVVEKINKQYPILSKLGESKDGIRKVNKELS